jgi:Fe-S oxidoreductase
MGRDAAALDAARHNVDAWSREIDGGGLTAILVTASGCGTTIKDYGYMLRDDPAYAAKPDVIATGNIGCAMQLGQRTGIPIVHTVELLDWASGGPPPSSLQHLQERNRG